MTLWQELRSPYSLGAYAGIILGCVVSTMGNTLRHPASRSAPAVRAATASPAAPWKMGPERWAKPVVISHAGKTFVCQKSYQGGLYGKGYATLCHIVIYPVGTKNLVKLLHTPSPGAALTHLNSDEIASLQ